uniref:Uncharacterized protein n=1 Tax=Arundo donax TaxID=35708 RepID=A0A0A9G0J9_ARUDO
MIKFGEINCKRHLCFTSSTSASATTTMDLFILNSRKCFLPQFVFSSWYRRIKRCILASVSFCSIWASSSRLMPCVACATELAW